MPTKIIKVKASKRNGKIVKAHTRYLKKDGSVKLSTHNLAKKGDKGAHKVLAKKAGEVLKKHKDMVGTSGNPYKGLRISPTLQLSKVNFHRKAAGLKPHTMGNYSAIKRKKK